MVIVPLTDEELLLRLRDAEDSFVERKPLRQQGDWLQTVIAFANSTPVNYPAVLFVGVDDRGVPQDGINPEQLQTSISSRIAQAYPPIYHVCRVLQIDGKPFVAVIVPGSPSRPHFAGQSYIRVGHQTMAASEPQLAAVIASRQEKAGAIMQHVGEDVTIWHLKNSAESTIGYRFVHSRSATLIACNAHYVTLRNHVEGDDEAQVASMPLSWIELSFDHAKGCLVFCIPATNLPSQSKGKVSV